MGTKGYFIIFQKFCRSVFLDIGQNESSKNSWFFLANPVSEWIRFESYNPKISWLIRMQDSLTMLGLLVSSDFYLEVSIYPLIFKSNPRNNWFFCFFVMMLPASMLDILYLLISHSNPRKGKTAVLLLDEWIRHQMIISNASFSNYNEFVNSKFYLISKYK